MEKLRLWRNVNGFTQAQFAAQAGLTAAEVSRFERGDRIPTVAVAKRISAATHGDISAAELLRIAAPNGLQETPAEYEADTRVPVSVSIPDDILILARDYGLDVESILAERGLEGFRADFKAAFAEHNRAGIDASKAYIRRYGTPMEQFGFMRREAE